MVTRVGILGCASIARRSLIPAFAAHSDFRLAAVASRSADKARAIAEQTGCSACSYEELLSSSAVDLIYCPLPTGLHYEWVKKSLLSGKHVLCEKSLGCDFRQVQDLIETARTHNRFLMESFQFRFHAQNLFVRELLVQNAIGPLREVVVRFGVPSFPDGASNIRYSKTLGGGALLDNGAYTVKCATYLLGPDIRIIAALSDGHCASFGGVDLKGAIMMEARKEDLGGRIPVQASFGFDHYYQNGYEIWGREGKICTTRAFTAREDFPAPVMIETKDGKVQRTFHDNHFKKMLDHVSQSLDSGSYDEEYEECLIQARLLDDVAKLGRENA